jgi:hypothetical protein
MRGIEARVALQQRFQRQSGQIIGAHCRQRTTKTPNGVRTASQINA